MQAANPPITQRPIIVVMFVFGAVFPGKYGPCRSSRRHPRLERRIASLERTSRDRDSGSPIAQPTAGRRRVEIGHAGVCGKLGDGSGRRRRRDVAARRRRRRTAGRPARLLAGRFAARCQSCSQVLQVLLRIGLVVRVEPLVDLVDVRPDDLLISGGATASALSSTWTMYWPLREAMIFSRCVWPSSVTAKNVIAMQNSTPLPKPTKAPIWRSNSLSLTWSMAPATTRIDHPDRQRRAGVDHQHRNELVPRLVLADHRRKPVRELQRDEVAHHQRRQRCDLPGQALPKAEDRGRGRAPLA